MKKFILKLLVYVAIISSLTIGINVFYIMNTGKESDIDNVPEGIQICNFGSSHGGNGFNYEDAKKKYVCFNFALHSQSLLYDYRILQHYRDNIRSGATVFITVSYFSFFGRPETESDIFESKNRRYYKFLPSEMILAYDWRTDLYLNWLPALSPEGLTQIFKLICGVKTETKKDDSQLDRMTDSADATIDAPQAYKRHIAKQRDENGVRMRRQESFEAFYGIIKLCNELGAKLILVTPPYTHEYTNEIKKNDPEFFGDFYSLIDEIKRGTRLEYYDYAFDERFCGDYSLFINSDHLNSKGARLFTDTLLLEALSIDVMPSK